MNEFGEFLRGLTREQADENIERVVASLVRINGVPVKSPDVVLRNMDTFERIIHWHEPPITVPQKISLTKQILPVEILPEEFKATGNPILYCINKPSSVPVYPAGPYYANSLLLMVEAQEGLPPKTLIPLHRIDRATSGLLLCADASSVAKVIQAKIISKCDESNPPVSKLYLARVKGKFPSSSVEGLTMPNELVGVASIVWCGDDANIIEVNAPIAVRLEPKENTPSGSIADQELNSMMHRTIAAEGKHSTSRFKLISYDAFTNHSLISCAPITGRGHQLRVHLQLIGFSIHNDVEYGGAANVEISNDQKNLSARSMLEAALAATSCHHEKTITSSEVESALQLCKCCIGGLDGIGASFNTAQLLAGGHAIDLHAYKYCLYFKEKEATIEMSTDLPSWATSFVDMMPNTLNWLK
jgi:23S rRNA-/tRNA-specific pseudouridylate synthase